MRSVDRVISAVVKGSSRRCDAPLGENLVADAAMVQAEAMTGNFVYVRVEKMCMLCVHHDAC